MRVKGGCFFNVPLRPQQVPAKLTKETNVRAGGGLCLPSYKSPSAPMRFHVHDRSPLPTDIVLHGKPWTIEGVLRDKHGGENCGPYSGPETHV